ncbi:MAG TPA: type III-B CRISPR module RAMP protein Cmr6 [Campylobacterales bacterium]|nr:type III-B CRISPR module RAMP protein Cmr6 [Campylobacterales bacterium]
MSQTNMGWLFYKKMYEQGNNTTHIKQSMEKLLDIKSVDEVLESQHGFRLKTTYPGLLIGSGYLHGLNSDEDAKIGFYFDHTTGLPLIQGSSVKGVLRSCFGLAVKGQNDPHKTEKHKMIRSLLNQESLDVEALAQEIFEGIDAESGKVKGMYKRDIFYEARVVEVKESLLTDDYLAPHGKDLLVNPVPLRFVKVAPEVTFEFSFDLKDSSMLTAEEKEKLFKCLLLEFGIGAKTNVGYGQFIET